MGAVIVAGVIAQSGLSGDQPVARTSDHLLKISDVCEAPEREDERVQGSICLPSQLRSRIAEVLRESPIAVLYHVGRRALVAGRIDPQPEFEARDLRRAAHVSAWPN